MAAQYYRHRIENQEKIGDHVTACHRNELDISLTALATRIREYLIVMMERPAFGKIRHQHGNERAEERESDENQAELMRSFPSSTCQAFEEFQDF